jgi:hypothetical protein
MSTQAMEISPASPPRIARRIAAVVAGLVAIFAITTATDVALHASGIFPGWDQRMSDPLFALATAYRVGYGVLGSYITGRLAPDRPMRHALVLGVIGVVLSIAGAIALGDRGPAWYSLAVIAMSMPCAWVGGFYARRATRTSKSGKGSASAKT